MTVILIPAGVLGRNFGNLGIAYRNYGFVYCFSCSVVGRGISKSGEYSQEYINNIKNNIDNTDFTVDSLCSLHNMSRTSFYNKLKALTGQSPADYIRDFRLNTAAQLLQKKKYSITEVAEMTGFCDSKYFREVFKKHFNVSPSKYGKEDKK